MTKFKMKKQQIILFSLAFLLPALIFGSYFIYRDCRILTVDLGQQYIDFLSYFKTKLFTDPLSLIYNFNLGLGGSFLGTLGYYLLSPFNWLLLLFPSKYLPQAILLIITLKIGALGLTSYYYWQKRFTADKKIFALAASLAYALCSYSINFNLNLMWLDSLILLPLLADAIDEIFSKQNKKYLVIITFLLWFTNFYTGYMTLLFGLGYFLVKLLSASKKQLKVVIKTYLSRSILGSCLAGVSLLPTFLALLAGKTQAETKWDLNWQYNPFDLISKLITGAYNFHEMEEGAPNLYFGITLFLLSLTYFISKKISLKAKISNFVFLSVLVLSLTFNPLVLVWHMGQYPVWYPGRFSFVLIFFLINLAVQVLASQKQFSIWQLLLVIIAGSCVIALSLLKIKNYSFLSPEKIAISAIFMLCSLLLFCFISNKWAPVILLALLGLETSVNLITSLNSISYQYNQNYYNFVSNTRQATHWLQQKETAFYRTEKTFNHTENDPLSDDYYGISLFDSISNSKDINFIDNLGLKNNDNSYSNQYSDLVTDSLLGIKYYLVPTLTRKELAPADRIEFNETYYRPDLYATKAIKNFTQIQIRQNSLALPLLFISPSASKVKFINSEPAENQTKLLNSITGKKIKLFTEEDWPEPATKNIDTWPGSWREYDRINTKKASYLTFDFICQSNDPYYLALTPDISSDTAELFINDHYIDTEELGNSTRLICLAYHDQGKHIKLKFKLHDKEVSLNNCQILKFDQQIFKQELTNYLKKQPKIYQKNALTLAFSQNSQRKAVINSTIPYSHNWLVFDNGKLIPTHYFAQTFLSFELKPGHHHFTLIYCPFELFIGLMITIIALILFIKLDFYTKK